LEENLQLNRFASEFWYIGYAKKVIRVSGIKLAFG